MSYPQEEDFTSRASDLDQWVFDRVLPFVRNATRESADEFFNGRSVLFLHLLGTDTYGHGYKPHSEEYLVRRK